MDLWLSPFWPAFAIGLAITRALSDWFKIRLHLTKFGPKISFVDRVKKTSGIHFHHFLWGFVFVVGDWMAPSPVLKGLAAALFYSEGKELVTMKWGP